jgi:hypothetical protein
MSGRAEARGSVVGRVETAPWVMHAFASEKSGFCCQNAPYFAENQGPNP